MHLRAVTLSEDETFGKVYGSCEQIYVIGFDQVVSMYFALSLSPTTSLRPVDCHQTGGCPSPRSKMWAPRHHASTPIIAGVHVIDQSVGYYDTDQLSAQHVTAAVARRGKQSLFSFFLYASEHPRIHILPNSFHAVRLSQGMIAAVMRSRGECPQGT